MTTQGVQSLDASAALSIAAARLGLDEIDSTEHLQEGGQATGTYWGWTCALNDP